MPNLLISPSETPVPHMKQTISVPLSHTEVSEDVSHYNRDPERLLKRSRMTRDRRSFRVRSHFYGGVRGPHWSACLRHAGRCCAGCSERVSSRLSPVADPEAEFSRDSLHESCKWRRPISSAFWNGELCGIESSNQKTSGSSRRRSPCRCVATAAVSRTSRW